MPQRQRTRTGEGLVQTGPGCPEARDESCVSPAHVENTREARRGRPLSRGGARRSPRRADKSQREIILAGAISPSFLFPSLLGELQSHSSYISSNSSRCQSSLRVWNGDHVGPPPAADFPKPIREEARKKRASAKRKNLMPRDESRAHLQQAYEANQRRRSTAETHDAKQRRRWHDEESSGS